MARRLIPELKPNLDVFEKILTSCKTKSRIPLPEKTPKLNSENVVAAGPGARDRDLNQMCQLHIRIQSFESQSKVETLPPHTKKIGLPGSRALYTVLRSPHIDKKSREQFDMKIKKQLLVVKTERHELSKKLFWLKRHRTFGAQMELKISYASVISRKQLSDLGSS